MVVKARLSGEVAAWLEEKKFYGEKSNVTSTALEFYHSYLFYRKGFFIKLIDLHFQEIRHLLRQIGRIKNE